MSLLDAPRRSIIEPPTRSPTDEQLDILNHAETTDANIMVNALAGTGKTTTIEMVASSDRFRSTPSLYLVFNKKNATEAEARLPSSTTVRTFNSLGHRIWADYIGKRIVIDAKKVGGILRSIIDEVKDKETKSFIWDSFSFITDSVGRAKALGYVPEGKFEAARRLVTQSQFHHELDEEPDDLVTDLIDAVLTRSITQAFSGTCDFNDQIYMPAVFGGSFPRFPLVLVDEYQDLNAVNHAMLNRLVERKNNPGRLIGVGDRWQNIYGFRGAKSSGMDEAQTHYAMTPLDLSVSFRCLSEVVKNAHWRVPHFKWIKEGGHVEVLKDGTSSTDFAEDAAIICRNNAPLFRLGMLLLGSGRSVSIAGSDIGPRLIGIMRKMGSEGLTRSQLMVLIEEWRADKLSKSSKTAADLADCMQVFASHGADLGQAIRYAEHLFAQRGRLQLLTGHKAKGLEYDCVYHLDPFLHRQNTQDDNLRYVIQTRSRDRFFEIDSDKITFGGANGSDPASDHRA